MFPVNPQEAIEFHQPNCIWAQVTSLTYHHESRSWSLVPARIVACRSTSSHDSTPRQESSESREQEKESSEQEFDLSGESGDQEQAPGEQTSDGS